jgi:tRNA pseudouridine13 synthase
VRLKTVPEDFRVRELLDFPSVADGEHFVHLLHKQKLSTPEALALLVREAEVDRADIAYAGLKDRQAVTDQYVSIRGRAVELQRSDLRLTPIGRTDHPITSRMSRGNAFTIVVRDLRPFEAAALRRGLPSLQKTGFPNYFDDQRFGSLRHGQGFPMLHVLRGDYEQALYRLVAQPSPVAISGDVKLKRALAACWGDWEACLDIARGPVYQPLFAHLREHPDDFRGAIEKLPLRQRVIHAFSYQSFLWNRAVSLLLRGGVGSAQRLRIPTLAGDLIAWKYLEPAREEKLKAMRTPLFALDGDGGSEPFRKAMIQELQNAGLQRDDFLRNEVPGMIWKEEHRDVLVKPADLQPPVIAPDTMHEGRVQATLSFALPRGAYATMLLKRLFAKPWYEREATERGDDPRYRGPSTQGDRERRGPSRRGPGRAGRFGVRSADCDPPRAMRPRDAEGPAGSAPPFTSEDEDHES